MSEHTRRQKVAWRTRACEAIKDAEAHPRWHDAFHTILSLSGAAVSTPIDVVSTPPVIRFEVVGIEFGLSSWRLRIEVSDHGVTYTRQNLIEHDGRCDDPWIYERLTWERAVDLLLLDIEAGAR